MGDKKNRYEGVFKELLRIANALISAPGLSKEIRLQLEEQRNELLAIRDDLAAA